MRKTACNASPSNSMSIAKRYLPEATKVDFSPKAILVSRGFNRGVDRGIHCS
jgi:hypothetical protein